MYRDLWVYSTYLLGLGNIFRDIPLLYNLYVSIAQHFGVTQVHFDLVNYFYDG